MGGMRQKPRCKWATTELYIEYHDSEWALRRSLQSRIVRRGRRISRARINHEVPYAFDGENRYPSRLEVENFGDKAAQALAWETRSYDVAWLPTYQSHRGKV